MLCVAVAEALDRVKYILQTNFPNYPKGTTMDAARELLGNGTSHVPVCLLTNYIASDRNLYRGWAGVGTAAQNCISPLQRSEAEVERCLILC